LNLYVHVLPTWVEAAELVVPAERDEVGRFGGDRGTTLLVGHVTNDGPGVFVDLARLRARDLVYVTSADGRRTSWRVVSRRTVPKDALPDSLWSHEGPRRLVLVTCGGEVVEALNHDGTLSREYLDNLLVTAVPAREHWCGHRRVRKQAQAGGRCDSGHVSRAVRTRTR
jgi:hypothetical protein